MNGKKPGIFACVVLLPVLGFILSTTAARRPQPQESRPGTSHRFRIPGQTATILSNGEILLLGGQGTEDAVATAALENPGTGEISSLQSSMLQARAWHTATILPDGTVLIFGGIGADGHLATTAELFDPATAQFTSIAPLGVTPRAHHTATLLTDGTVFFAGGMNDSGQALGSAQVWAPRANTTIDVPEPLIISRSSHSATLLADGAVLLWEGNDASGVKLGSGEIYDPATKHFLFQASQPAMDHSPVQLAATIPADGSQDVPVNALIAVRFSQPIAMRSVDGNAISLAGPDGKIPARVVAAEGGMLAFVTPKQALMPGASYTVTLNGIGTNNGRAVPESSFSFSTAAATGESSTSGTPGPAKSGNSNPPPLVAPPGITAISGQVLLQNGVPLRHVTLRVGSLNTQTDEKGRFLLSGVPLGRDVLIIDGRTANTPQATYGLFEDGVTVIGGQTNILSYTIWMPVLDTAHAVTISFPTTQDTTITTPLIPGLELHLPAGTTITDIDGKVVSQISITPIPVSQPPFPLPAGVEVPTYFTIQPGGSRIRVNNSQGAKGATLIYPNAYHAPAGALFNFWNYDAEDKGWYVYGHGTVPAGGHNVIPNPGTVLYELTGAMVAGSNQAPGGGPCDCGPGSGDPVDLGTGLFVYNKMDLYEPDVIPIALTRTYRQGDGASRAFGIGTQNGYEMYIVGDFNSYQFAEIVLADGSQINYTRTSPGTTFFGAVFQTQSNSGRFFGSTVTSCWTLTTKEGTSYAFPCNTNPPSYRFDALSRITDRHGNTVTITRDANANISKVTSPNGRFIQFTYDTSNRVTQAQDQIGRTVSYVYDANGRLTHVTDVNNGLWQYAYDANNNMTSITDPRGIVYLQNQYDANGRVSVQTQADTGTYHFAYQTNANNNIIETDVTDPNGNIQKVTFNTPIVYPNGFTTGGAAATVTYAAGTPQQQVFTNQYQAVTNLLTGVTDPLNRVTSFSYDSLGNVTKITRLAGTSNAVSTSFTYDPTYSQLTSVSDPLNRLTNFSLNSTGDPVSITDPLGNVSTFTYDSQGRILTATDAASETTSFTYTGPDLTSTADPLNRALTLTRDGAGRLLTVSTPMGHVTQYAYNPLDQVTSITDPLGGITSFTYDGNGNVLSVTDPEHASAPTTYTYDPMDRVQTRTDPLSHSESYAYDHNGNLTQFTDRRGKITTYGYDALNRLNFAGFGTLAGPAYESTLSPSYDSGNRLTQVVDSIAGTFTRTYDGLDQPTQEQGPKGTVTYSYDAARRRTQMTVSGQSSPILYSYDDDDRLTGITQGSLNLSFSHDAVGRRTSLMLPNGVVVGYSYDQASEITGLTYSLAGTTLGSLTYTYDQDGRRAQTGGSWARVAMPNATNGTAVFNADNQLTNWGATSFTYDANGNMTSDGVNSFTWDARNHLTSISGGSAASFVYDPFGRRFAKSINGTTTGFLYDRSNAVQELSGNTVIANLLTGGIDEIFTRSDAGGASSHLKDTLGSTVALTDSNANVAASYTYDPFGNTAITGAGSTNAFQYTGRENDGSNLYYYRTRYYNPTLGRFISEDPLGFTGSGANLYTYADDDPINSRDPLGLFSCDKHKEITRRAALWAGYSSADAEALAQQVCDVDDDPNGQKNDAAHTHQHAMSGRKNGGDFETCSQAFVGTEDLVRRMAMKGDLAHALHAIQDAWPFGHWGYQPWDGYFSWPQGTDPILHYLGDHWPADWQVDSAVAESYLLLRDYRNNLLNDSSGSWYLPDSCQ